MAVADMLSLSHISFWLGALFVCIFCYRAFIRPYFFSPLRHIPGPPKIDPFLGHFNAIVFGEPGAVQGEWLENHGPIVNLVGPFGYERVQFAKPAALHQIFLHSVFNVNPQPEFIRQLLGLLAGYGLFTATGSEHKLLRKAMSPAFSIPNLMTQMESFYNPAWSLVEIWQSLLKANNDTEGALTLNVSDWMSKVTLDAICKAAFGYTTDSLHNPDNDLAHSYESILNLQSGLNLAVLGNLVAIPGVSAFFRSELAYRYLPLFRRLPGSLKLFAVLIESMHRIKEISKEMLDEKSAEASVESADTATKKTDIMSLLVRARMFEKDGGYKMSDVAMVDQVLTFLGAGHETTASGLSWTLWLLANHPAYQDKLRQEVSALLSDDLRPDYRKIKDQQWLDCIVMESLRLMPPVPVTVRTATKDMHIDGTYLPKGTLVMIPIRAINCWTEVWGPDAGEFRPERWLNLPSTYNPAYSFFSFTAGPHGCIGKTMAIVEMKVILAVLLANFEFSPAYPCQKVKPTAAITMKPEDGLPLRVRAIAKESPIAQGKAE